MRKTSQRISSRIISFLQNMVCEKSFALNALDKKLDLFIQMRNGFFVEVGANDGFTQSNTYFFEKYRGWKGLLIEPIPELSMKCKKNRPNAIVENSALVSNEYNNTTITMEYCNLMSIVNDGTLDERIINNHLTQGKKHLQKDEKIYSISVPANTLSFLLYKHEIKDIDLLSVDVEGYELEVIKGLDFQVHKPKFILVEERNYNSMNEFLNEFYISIAFLSINSSYKDVLYKLKEEFQ